MAEFVDVLMRRVTEVIWNRRHLDLIDELVSEQFVDHVDIPGLLGAEARSRSVPLSRGLLG